jgi:hypothetical protein
VAGWWRKGWWVGGLVADGLAGWKRMRAVGFVGSADLKAPMKQPKFLDRKFLAGWEPARFGRCTKSDDAVAHGYST